MDQQQEQPKNSFWKFLLLVFLLIAGFFIAKHFQVDLEQYRETFRSYPIIISGPIFIAIYVVTTTLVLVGPHDVLKISSALLFGAKVSTILLSIAELMNASILFGLSRWLGREYVEKKFKWKVKKSMYEPERKTSLLMIMALRLNPLIPFRFLDIGFGLSNVSFAKYFIAILLVSPFRLYWLQMIIEGVGENIFKDMSAVMTYMLDHPEIVRYSSIYFLVVIVLTIAAFMLRNFQKKMEKEKAI